MVASSRLTIARRPFWHVIKYEFDQMSSGSPNALPDPPELNMHPLPKELRRSIVETLGAPVILVDVYGVSGILTAEHVIF